MNANQKLLKRLSKKVREKGDMKVYKNGKLMKHPDVVKDMVNTSFTGAMQYMNYMIDYLHQAENGR